VFLFCVVVFCINIAIEFYKFSDFKDLEFRFLHAYVEQSYQKTNSKNRTYFVSKLKTDDFSFYTTSKFKLTSKRVTLVTVTKKVTFFDYISKSFYMPSFKIQPVLDAPKTEVQTTINSNSQHSQNANLQNTSNLNLSDSKTLQTTQNVNLEMGEQTAKANLNLQNSRDFQTKNSQKIQNSNLQNSPEQTTQTTRTAKTTNTTNTKTKITPTIPFYRQANYTSRTRQIYTADLPPVPLSQRARDYLEQSIRAQHKNEKMGEFYAALFLATPISKALRTDVVNWGVGHLVAISGYHLGLLFGMFYFVLRLSTKPFYDVRPYRNFRFELSLLIFVLLTAYLFVLDFTPSFLRSFVMSIFAFFFLARGLSVFKLSNLLLTIAVSVSFAPHLLFSLGFYLSCLGVYFIFLYVRYFGEKDALKTWWKVALHAICFEIFVFGAMNVPVYFFFHSASLYQMCVIPLGYIFGLFFPVTLVLHAFGFGFLFDEFLLRYIGLAHEQTQIVVPFWAFLAFNAALLFAFKFRFVGILLSVTGMLVFLIPCIFAVL